MPNALCHFGISYLKEVWPIKYFTHRLVKSFINEGEKATISRETQFWYLRNIMDIQSKSSSSTGPRAAPTAVKPTNMFEKIIDSVDKMSASKYTVTSGLLAAGCIKNIFWGED